MRDTPQTIDLHTYTFEENIEHAANIVAEDLQRRLNNQPPWNPNSKGTEALYHVHRYYGKTSLLKTINPEKISATMIHKHYAYGKGSLDHHGLKGIEIRIDDKIGRIVNLIQTGWDPKDETVEDTIFDLYGYAVLEHLYRTRLHEAPYVGDTERITQKPPMEQLQQLADRNSTDPF